MVYNVSNTKINYFLYSMEHKAPASKIAGEVKLGLHVCSIYQNKEQQFSELLAFFKTGLENNHKCIYIVNENTKEEVTAIFEKAEIDLKKYIESGQFLFLTKKETYLKDGFFDPDEMIALLKQTEADAIKEGYAGMRITGEMTWLLDNLEDSKKLIEYEAKLNDFFPRSNSSAVCQYNENKFEPELLIDVIRTHPQLIIHGVAYENKYFYTPPQYLERAKGVFQPDSYKTMLEMIKEDNHKI